MAYSLAELIEKFRRDNDDRVEPYLWSDDEIKEYLDQAQDEFLEETSFITDNIDISYTAADEYLVIPEYVTRAKEAKASSGKDVGLYNEQEWLEAMRADDYGLMVFDDSWQSTTGEEPSALITDIKSQRYRLYPIPEQDGVITLNVFRTARVSPIAGEDLEVAQKWGQRAILIRARSLAYDKHDAEAYNPKMSEDLQAKFLAMLDKANTRVKRSRRRARAVTYGGL